MPKVSFKKEYNKPPIVIFKYDNSKSYYLRFYVDKKYKSNGCEERSLGRNIKTLREAEQKQKRLERGQEIARLAQQKKIVEAEKQQQLTIAIFSMIRFLIYQILE